MKKGERDTKFVVKYLAEMRVFFKINDLGHLGDGKIGDC